jgi:gas vesicle protein
MWCEVRPPSDDTMSNDNQGRGPDLSHLLLALLGGAAAGAAVVYLTAPRSGEERRRRIHALPDDAHDTAVRLPIALRKATEAARDAFEATLREGATS